MARDALLLVERAAPLGLLNRVAGGRIRRRLLRGRGGPGPEEDQGHRADNAKSGHPRRPYCPTISVALRFGTWPPVGIEATFSTVAISTTATRFSPEMET